MGKQILIIDDDSSIRDAFLSALEATGYTVETATTGEEGVAKAKDHKFDLIYLDLKMPGIGGVEVLKMIRRFDADIPIYLITAFHDEYLKDLESVGNEGIHFELLKKPLERHQIQEITNSIFGC